MGGLSIFTYNVSLHVPSFRSIHHQLQGVLYPRKVVTQTQTALLELCMTASCMYILLLLLLCSICVVTSKDGQLLDQLSLLTNKDHHTSVPIVLATVECYTHSSVLIRNLLFSISRYTSAQHPVRIYIGHTYDQSLLSHPQLIICQHIEKCDTLLHYLREEKYLDVRFLSVANNSYVEAFRPCSSSHLWFADILPKEEDKVIYLDRDMIVLQDLYPLWELFHVFPKQVTFALAQERNPEHLVAVKRVSPYRSGIKDKPGPYYIPPHGLNTGMALYHLQRMRQHHVVRDFEAIIRLKMNLPLADQDIINYYSIQQPFRYAVLSCKWNQRANYQKESDHCNFRRSDTNTKLENGILHGSRGIFLHTDMLKQLYLKTSKKKTTTTTTRTNAPHTTTNEGSSNTTTTATVLTAFERIIDQYKPHYKVSAKQLMLEFFKNDMLMNSGEEYSRYWNC